MRAAHSLAAAVYLGIAVWAYRAVLPAPSAMLPVPAFLRGGYRELDHDDQQMVIAVATHNAHALVTNPSTLLDGGQCYPLPRSFTLGEHEFVEGLLGVLPYAVTGDPLVTYNALTVLVVWLAAIAMYALAYDATGSPGGAFVAGFLFAFRLFVRPSWAAAGALASFATLQTLDGVYQTFAFAILGAVFGVWLLAVNVRRLPAILPKLAVAVGLTVAIALLCYAPYMRTKRVWGTLGGHD